MKKFFVVDQPSYVHTYFRIIPLVKIKNVYKMGPVSDLLKRNEKKKRNLCTYSNLLLFESLDNRQIYSKEKKVDMIGRVP